MRAPAPSPAVAPEDPLGEHRHRRTRLAYPDPMPRWLDIPGAFRRVVATLRQAEPNTGKTTRRREPSARPVDAGRPHRVHAQHGRRPRPRRGRVDVGAVRGGSDARQGPPRRRHRPPRRSPVRRRPDVEAAPRHRRGRHRRLGLPRAGRATPRSTACSTSTRRPSAARVPSSAGAASTPSSTPSASSTTSPAPEPSCPERPGLTAARAQRARAPVATRPAPSDSGARTADVLCCWA